MSQANVEVVRRFLDALLLGDMEAVLAEVDPEVEVDDLDIALDTDHYRGHAGFLRWLTVWNESWSSWTIEGLEVLAVGQEQVISLFVMRAKGAGSGIELNRPDAVTFRFRESKIVEIAYYNDQDQARDALGLQD